MEQITGCLTYKQRIVSMALLVIIILMQIQILF